MSLTHITPFKLLTSGSHGTTAGSTYTTTPFKLLTSGSHGTTAAVVQARPYVTATKGASLCVGVLMYMGASVCTRVPSYQDTMQLLQPQPQSQQQQYPAAQQQQAYNSSGA